MRIIMEANDFLSIAKIPEDLNAELLINNYSEGVLRVKFRGLHHRNSYKDILCIDKESNTNVLSLGRNSIYNTLPEYLFHPIDRFENISQHNGREKFEDEYYKQEKEKEDAFHFFAPLDALLLQLRLEIRKYIDPYIVENKILIDVICDTLTEKQRENRFIQKVLPSIPYCKVIRGDKTMITLMLRKVLKDEEIDIYPIKQNMIFIDDSPRYENTLGGIVNDVYVGNSFDEEILRYNVTFWSEDECNESFNVFLNDIEVFRQFVQDYFMSVDSILEFNVYTTSPTLRLSDTTVFNYLNYNTYI